MLRAEVNWEICQGCEPCEARRACRTRALVKIEPGEPVYVEFSRCNGCGKCVTACIFDAIIMINGTDSNIRHI